jgi:hypothetical protein
MRKTILMLLAAIIMVSQLSGCVVYDRPGYGYHYYHGWYR